MQSVAPAGEKAGDAVPGGPAAQAADERFMQLALAQARQGAALDCAAANALHPALRARVLRAFAPVELTAREFDVLELLMRNPNRVYSRENLLDLIWGYEYSSDIRTVDVHIRRIREKIESVPAEPEYIMTKWGVGYYFKA